uniref:CSON004043 protein n=1 Tax=Culicoides sonorensis TaxID=179676 RepID=A0A336MQ09_CULSO
MYLKYISLVLPAYFIILIVFGPNSTVYGGNLIKSDYIERLPEYINVCHANDPKLNECVKKSILNLRPYLSNGIPELSIPSVDPLEIDQINLEQDSGPINLNSRFDNIKMYGLSEFRIRAVRVDAEKAKFRLRLWFPELHMVADYYVKGKFLMVPMVGNGKSTGNFSDVDAIASLKAERFTRNGREYLKVKDIFAEFNIGHASVHLDSLFNGNQELSDTLNKFLNENWRAVTAEIKPELEDFISNLLNETTTTLFDRYPYEQLLPSK